MACPREQVPQLLLLSELLYLSGTFGEHYSNVFNGLTGCIILEFYSAMRYKIRGSKNQYKGKVMIKKFVLLIFTIGIMPTIAFASGNDSKEQLIKKSMYIQYLLDEAHRCLERVDPLEGLALAAVESAQSRIEAIFIENNCTKRLDRVKAMIEDGSYNDAAKALNEFVLNVVGNSTPCLIPK